MHYTLLSYYRETQPAPKREREEKAEKPIPVPKKKIKVTETSQTSGEKKKNVCTVCPYSTNIKSDLTRHMRIHSGDKPYKCTYDGCVYKCSRADALTMHIRSTHTGEKIYMCNHEGTMQTYTCYFLGFLLNNIILYSLLKVAFTVPAILVM